MPKHERLLRLLADGRFHSGAALGEALGVGRSAVWKQVQVVETMGLEIYAVRGKGYRLAAPLEFLDREAILAGLEPAHAKRLGGLEIFSRIDSTNRYLMERSAQGLEGPYLCLAESQSAGRGRRGRSWSSPYGRNLYLSLLWQFELGADALSGLSLAAGVAVAEALESIGVDGIGVKWPNDLFYSDRKLGGLLIEIAGEASGPWKAVIGVGLNIDMAERCGADIDQPWTDIATVLGQNPGRNRLAALVVDALMKAMSHFERSGLAPFRASFERLDIARGREVELHWGANCMQIGRARGIGEHGALLLETDGGVSQITSGDISLRITE